MRSEDVVAMYRDLGSPRSHGNNTAGIHVVREGHAGFKTSYPPKEKDRHDIAELAATFGFTVPPTYRLGES